MNILRIWGHQARVVSAFLWLCLALAAPAAEVIPPAPARYFNDYAKVVSPAVADRLNRVLEDFEKQASSQVVVAIFPKMASESSLEDYTVRVFEAWKVGQKSKNNGVVLFVFAQDRRLRIEVGYGLEGALPDVLAKRIIEDEIKPFFARGNYEAGLTAGINAILKATQGEYRGTGQTTGGARTRTKKAPPFAVVVLFVIFMIVAGSSRRRGTVLHGGGSYGSGWIFSGGGSSGGGFSGGGGSSGGGGASGSW